MASPTEEQKQRNAERAVLLVEDNLHNRRIFSGILTHFGFEVREATDGEEALEMVQADPPDLILMDLSLPVMDGWEATRRIKAIPELQHIPILALTAHAMSGDRERCLEAGCDDYATKPVERGALLRKCRALIASAGPDPVLPVDPERGRSVLDHRSPSG